MTTSRTRTIVSLAALTAAASSLAAVGGCARNPAPITWDGAAAEKDELLLVHFDNQAETYVDVYLVGQRREWRLGRVSPGMRGTLRVPADAREELASGLVRLAALAGSQYTAHVELDPRATFTIPETAWRLSAKQWTFRQSQVSAPEIFSAPGVLGRP
jgi:hypothetical protein